MAMLDSVKIALRRTGTDAFDDEIQELIEAAKLDLGIAGVNEPEGEEPDPLILMAVKTYCKMHFGETDEYDRLKASYDEQKAQLQMSNGYTNFDEYGVKSALEV